VITNLSGVAVIKGVVYDKNCFMKIFKTRGKYNDFGDDNLPKAEAERKKAASVSGNDQTSPRLSVTDKPKPVSETKPVSEATNVPLVQLKKVGPPAEKSTQPAAEAVSPAAKLHHVETPKEETPKHVEEAPAKQVDIEEPVKESKEEAPVEKQEETPAAEETPAEKPAEEAPAEKPAEEAPAEPAAEPVADAVVDVEAPAADEPAPVEAAVEPAAEAEPVEV